MRNTNYKTYIDSINSNKNLIERYTNRHEVFTGCLPSETRNIPNFNNQNSDGLNRNNALNSTSMDTPTEIEEKETMGRNSRPEIFGPPLWFSLHNGALNYPEVASPIVKERMKSFILALPIMLPCETCKNHANEFIENNKEYLETICSTRENLFNFFVDFHNNVNRFTNKPIMSKEGALKLYSENIKITKFSYVSI